MKNYMMINGKKIEISDETAKNMEAEFSEKSPQQKVLDKYLIARYQNTVGLKHKLLFWIREVAT